jgi:hypothetical protein
VNRELDHSALDDGGAHFLVGYLEAAAESRQNERFGEVWEDAVDALLAYRRHTAPNRAI